MNILITGANRGIGFEVAKQLGEKEHQIFVTARNESDKNDTVARLEALGINRKAISW